MGVRKSFLLMNFYLGGLDVPIPRLHPSFRYDSACTSIERNVEFILRKVGNDQREKNIKS